MAKPCGASALPAAGTARARQFRHFIDQKLVEVRFALDPFNRNPVSTNFRRIRFTDLASEMRLALLARELAAARMRKPRENDLAVLLALVEIVAA